MSARPSVPRLGDEELDLLISRSLDGDLSPEEERNLEIILTHDPAAARRKEDLARVVAETRALPEPAPPFALATRVNSNVSEKASRPGAVWHRFGFYPPPGFSTAVMILLGFLAIGLTVMKPAPKGATTAGVGSTVAERSDGPVDVFFTEAKPATREADKEAAKEPPPARNEIAAQRVPAAVVAMAPGAEEKEQVEVRKDATKPTALARQEPASVVASNDSVSGLQQRKKLAKAESAPNDEGSLKSTVVTAASPVLVTDAAAPAPEAAAGAVAPSVSRAMRANAAPATSWSVVVRGEGARHWMLRQAPQSRPSSSIGQPSTFRITLNAEGHVTSVRSLDARPVQPALMEFVRGLVFTQTPAAQDAGVRDEKAKADHAETAAEPIGGASEIEVEVSAH